MYDTLVGTWQTPSGNSITLEYRKDTVDLGIIESTLVGDEYRIGALSLSGVAFDVGAYLGSVSVALALDNPGLRVFTLEPVPSNLRLCQANVQRNGVADRVEVIEGAVGGPGQTLVRVYYNWVGAEPQLQKQMFVGNSTVLLPSRLPRDYHEVISYSMTDLVDLAGELPSFVKLDCEGGEWFVLADPIVTRVPRIHGEWHSIRGRKRAHIEAVLAATHDLVFVGGPEDDQGLFMATLRNTTP